MVHQRRRVNETFNDISHAAAKAPTIPQAQQQIPKREHRQKELEIGMTVHTMQDENACRSSSKERAQDVVLTRTVLIICCSLYCAMPCPGPASFVPAIPTGDIG